MGGRKERKLKYRRKGREGKDGRKEGKEIEV